MRALFKLSPASKLALTVVLFALAPAAFAQGGGTSTIAVEGPWARATPSRLLKNP